MMGLNMGFGGLWLLVWILGIGLGVWAIWSLFPQSARQVKNAGRPRDPLEIAKERYARGELSSDEYQLLRKDLEQS